VLVVLTRELGHNESLRHRVLDQAPHVDLAEVPLTTTEFRSRDEVRDELRASRHFGNFASLVVTSARAQGFVDLAREALGSRPEVFSVGPATSAALERAHLAVTREGTGSARELAPFITRAPVLVLGAARGRGELPDALERRALACEVVSCYLTRAASLSPEDRATLGRGDVVFVGAPSAWRVASPHVRADAWVLVPGDTTWAAVRRDHDLVVRGWGDDFADAWRRVSGVAP
jgi:uroporphyrinogen-III synthase